MDQNSKKEKSITLGDLFRVVRKNIILMLSIVVGAIAIGLVYCLAIATPIYRSKADVNVAVASTTSSDGISSTDSLRITQTVAYVTKSEVTRNKAAEIILGSSATADEIQALSAKIGSRLSTVASSDSYIVNIYVKDTDPARAKEYCQAVADAVVYLFANETALEDYKATLFNINPASNGSYYSPNKTLYMIIITLIGGVVACVVVFIKEFLSNKFKTREEIEDIIGEPAIGLFVDNKQYSKDNNVHLETPSIRNYEQYNKLLANIRYANVDNPYRTLMITSTDEDELKSTTLANLACCIANNNKKVVIVDLDLRKPTVHKTFNVIKEKGVTEYVQDNLSIDDFIKNTEYNVDIITSGAKIDNPVVILDSQKIADLIEGLKNRYDYVLIDTPPLAYCSDSKIISKLVDGIMYNVSINQVNKKIFVESVTQLEAVDANIVGYNIVKIPAGKFDKDYYYKYYSRYYSDEVDNSLEDKKE